MIQSKKPLLGFSDWVLTAAHCKGRGPGFTTKKNEHGDIVQDFSKYGTGAIN